MHSLEFLNCWCRPLSLWPFFYKQSNFLHICHPSLATTYHHSRGQSGGLRSRNVSSFLVTLHVRLYHKPSHSVIHPDPLRNKFCINRWITWHHLWILSYWSCLLSFMAIKTWQFPLMCHPLLPLITTAKINQGLRPRNLPSFLVTLHVTLCPCTQLWQYHTLGSTEKQALRHHQQVNESPDAIAVHVTLHITSTLKTCKTEH